MAAGTAMLPAETVEDGDLKKPEEVAKTLCFTGITLMRRFTATVRIGGSFSPAEISPFII